MSFKTILACGRAYPSTGHMCSHFRNVMPAVERGKMTWRGLTSLVSREAKIWTQTPCPESVPQDGHLVHFVKQGSHDHPNTEGYNMERHGRCNTAKSFDLLAPAMRKQRRRPDLLEEQSAPLAAPPARLTYGCEPLYQGLARETWERHLES